MLKDAKRSSAKSVLVTREIGGGQPLARRIIIGCDHAGYLVKAEIIKHLRDRDFQVVDVGANSEEIVRYPTYAVDVAGAIARQEFDRGILICATGIGMSIAANKIKGIRAALCTSVYMAKATRRHNDSNILCLGGKVTGIFELLEIVDAWLSHEFEGGRHAISLDLIKEMEQEMVLKVPPRDPR